MSHKLYDINLSVLATYKARIAACDGREAKTIAQEMIFEHIAQTPPMVSLVDRDIAADDVAEVGTQPRMHRVFGIYQLRFELDLPAENTEEAVLHARRIYDANMGPFEFTHDGGDVVRLKAEEIRS